MAQQRKKRYPFYRWRHSDDDVWLDNDCGFLSLSGGVGWMIGRRGLLAAVGAVLATPAIIRVAPLMRLSVPRFKPMLSLENLRTGVEIAQSKISSGDDCLSVMANMLWQVPKENYSALSDLSFKTTREIGLLIGVQAVRDYNVILVRADKTSPSTTFRGVPVELVG